MQDVPDTATYPLLLQAVDPPPEVPDVHVVLVGRGQEALGPLLRLEGPVAELGDLSLQGLHLLPNRVHCTLDKYLSSFIMKIVRNTYTSRCFKPIWTISSRFHLSSHFILKSCECSHYRIKMPICLLFLKPSQSNIQEKEIALPI